MKSKEKKQDLENVIGARLSQILNSSIFIFLGILSANLFTYFYKLIIARSYGPEWFGIFSLALMASTFVASIFALGIPESIVRFNSRYLGQKSINKSRYLIKLTSITLWTASIIGGIIVFFSAELIAINIFSEPKLVNPIKFFSLLVPLILMFNFYLGILLSHEKIRWYSLIANTLPTGSRLIILIVIIFLGFGTDSIFVSYVTSYILSLLALFYILGILLPKHKNQNKINTNEKKKINKELIEYSLPLIFVGFLTKIYFWTDSFFIGYYLDAANVGIYNVAVSIALLLTLVPPLFLQIFVPIVNKEYSKGNKNVVQQLSQQIGKWIFIINLPVLILFFTFPGAIINILFGEEFLPGATPLKILVIAAFINSLGLTSEKLILMKGKTKLLFFNLVITSIANIILNILLIPRFGINGAAMATSLAWIIMTFLLLIEVNKTLSIIPIRRKVITIALTSVIPFLILILLESYIQKTLFSIVLTVIIFLSVYFILIFKTNSLDRYEIMILSSIKNHLQRKKK